MDETNHYRPNTSKTGLYIKIAVTFLGIVFISKGLEYFSSNTPLPVSDNILPIDYCERPSLEYKSDKMRSLDAIIDKQLNIDIGYGSHLTKK